MELSSRRPQAVKDTGYKDLEHLTLNGNPYARIHYSYVAFWDEGYTGWKGNNTT